MTVSPDEKAAIATRLAELLLVTKRRRAYALMGGAIAAFIAIITHSPLRRLIAFALLAACVVSFAMASRKLSQIRSMTKK